jgi:hypothetical protein
MALARVVDLLPFRAGAVLDGDFAGYAGDELRVVLREFDSTSWNVRTTDASVIREIHRHCPDSAPTPEDILQEIPWPTSR